MRYCVCLSFAMAVSILYAGGDFSAQETQSIKMFAIRFKLPEYSTNVVLSAKDLSQIEKCKLKSYTITFGSQNKEDGVVICPFYLFEKFGRKDEIARGDLIMCQSFAQARNLLVLSLEQAFSLSSKYWIQNVRSYLGRWDFCLAYKRQAVFSYATFGVCFQCKEDSQVHLLARELADAIASISAMPNNPQPNTEVMSSRFEP